MIEIVRTANHPVENRHIHNPAVVSLLVKHSTLVPERYPISYMAKIINRTSLGNNGRNPSIRCKIPPEDLFLTQGKVQAFTSYLGEKRVPYEYSITRGGKYIYYEGLTLPGYSYGKEIYDQLDAKWAQLDIDQLSTLDKLHLIAFVSIIIGTNHAFFDGNGRTDRGMVTLLLDRLLGRKIDADTLYKRKNTYADFKQGATVRLLPGKYNPQYLFEQLDHTPYIRKYVKIPGVNNELKAELPDFLKGYRDSIINFIDCFSLPLPLEMPDFLDILFQLRLIASFYDFISKN